MFTLTSKKLINNKSISNFIEKYAHSDNFHNIDSSTGNLGYGWLHYAIIRNLKPKNILCIGSRYGYIPAICATACRDNGLGVVDFVDASLDYTKNDHHHWGGMGVWKKINPNNYFKPFNVADYIRLHVETSKSFEKKHHTNRWQYIYIDGDHSYVGARSDFKLFWPQLDPGGFFMLHDIYTKSSGSEKCGVPRLWKEIKVSQSSFEFPGENGLGMIQKNET